MYKVLTAMLLLVVPCMSSAIPPSPDSPMYVAPPEFIDTDTDDPRSANHLLQGVWESSWDQFAFEIKLLKFRVLGAECDWIDWEWLNLTFEPIGGEEQVLTKFTIRVVAKPGLNACLEAPMPIYVVFVSPPKHDLAEVALGAGWSNQQDLLMTRRTP